MDAKTETQSGVESVAFDLPTKDRALKILMDYSALTGKKWGAIRAEIMSVTGATANEDRLLTRQDLEAWAMRRSVLGDSKFRWVFAFLTHPSTLVRPHFTQASILVDLQVGAAHVGRTLAEMFTDLDLYLSRDMRSLSGRQRHVRTRISTEHESYLRSLTGIYVDDRTPLMVTVLSLQHMPHEEFLVAHLFRFGPAQTNGDKNIVRHRSGYATLGRDFLLHIRDTEPSPLSVAVHAILYPRRHEPVFDMLDERFFSDLERSIGRAVLEPDTENQLSPNRYSLPLTLSNNERFLSLLDGIDRGVPTWR